MYRVTPSSVTMVVLSTSGVGEVHVQAKGSQVEGERMCGPEGVAPTSLSKLPCHDTAKII